MKQCRRTVRHRGAAARAVHVLLALPALLLLPGCQVMAVNEDSPSWTMAVEGSAVRQPLDLSAEIFSNKPLLSLVGDPEFDEDDLDEGQRLWYRRLWAAIDNPEQYPDSSELARSDDEYDFARLLYGHNYSLLLGLRATGDLRFLDEIDDAAQEMRESLRDRWCGDVKDSFELSSYGELSGKDGYLNFRRRVSSDEEHYCRDASDLEEALMHGHLAMLMYAFHVNRDNESPAGIDYGERADFWLDYLRNHFEAKWRERSGVRFPDMDFIQLKFCHTYSTFILYHYYVGKRLQDEGDPAASAYLNQALSLTDALFETPYRANRQPGGFMPVETPLGEAVVYSFGAPSSTSEAKDTHMEACPSTYARLMAAGLVQLHLEQFHRWDDEILGKLSTGIAHFVVDREELGEGDEAFAAGVTGDDRVRGIPPTTYRDRLDADKFALSAFPALSPWDASGRLLGVSLEVYHALEDDADEPRRVFIPAAMLLYHSTAPDWQAERSASPGDYGASLAGNPENEGE
jgi:hypothetical protein